MRYKTIVLELLQEQYPKLHEKLRQERTLLQAMDQQGFAVSDFVTCFQLDTRFADV